jgi:ribosomal protein S14
MSISRSSNWPAARGAEEGCYKVGSAARLVSHPGRKLYLRSVLDLSSNTGDRSVPYGGVYPLARICTRAQTCCAPRLLTRAFGSCRRSVWSLVHTGPRRIPGFGHYSGRPLLPFVLSLTFKEGAVIQSSVPIRKKRHCSFFSTGKIPMSVTFPTRHLAASNSTLLPLLVVRINLTPSTAMMGSTLAPAQCAQPGQNKNR